MEFTTRVDISKQELNINHETRIIAFGSCFAENISRLLSDNKFDILTNPFGVLYNPQSITEAIDMLLIGKVFEQQDLFQYKGLYHSFYHHGSFSHADSSQCLLRINSTLEQAQRYLQTAEVLFVTFGTSYVFALKEDRRIVGNCHKLPASYFERNRLSVDEIVNTWTTLIERLRQINPHLKVIFTVSPIRHLKDGAHGSQLSKAVLLLAIERLQILEPDIYYFPSYEIVLDELRDYRFYEEDMTHPSKQAIKYIWERFSETYFSQETNTVIREWSKIYAAINHRVINENSDEYKHFLRQTLLKLQSFNDKYPYICLEEELSLLENKQPD